MYDHTGPLSKTICDPHSVAIFHGDPICYFEITMTKLHQTIVKFCLFGLKMPIHAEFWGIWGNMTHK